MYNYLAILNEKEVSKKTLKKYFEENNIKVEKIYSTIGVIKLISRKVLIANELDYVSDLELDTKKYKINKKKSKTK